MRIRGQFPANGVNRIATSFTQAVNPSEVSIALLTNERKSRTGDSAARVARPTTHLNQEIIVPKTTKIGRDARTGEFIPVKEALKRPSTTTVETIKRK